VDGIKQLTDLQMAVMSAVWRRGEATTTQVHAALEEERQLALTTVSTILSRLEKYGLLTHRTEGRQYVYRALVSQNEVRRSRITEVIDQFFQGSPADLVYHLISESEVTDDELEKILALIEAREKGGPDDDQ
jgi:BlaI family penicillinase repressor